MKNVLLRLMTLTILTFLTGCSFLSPKEKIKIIVPVKREFVKIEVKPFAPLEKIEPIELTGKLSFTDDTNSSVSIPVDIWMKIRENNSKKDTQLKKREIREYVYKKSYESYGEQIARHMGWE